MSRKHGLMEGDPVDNWLLMAVTINELEIKAGAID